MSCCCIASIPSLHSTICHFLMYTAADTVGLEGPLCHQALLAYPKTHRSTTSPYPVSVPCTVVCVHVFNHYCSMLVVHLVMGLQDNSTTHEVYVACQGSGCKHNLVCVCIPVLLYSRSSSAMPRCVLVGGMPCRHSQLLP